MLSFVVRFIFLFKLISILAFWVFAYLALSWVIGILFSRLSMFWLVNPYELIFAFLVSSIFIVFIFVRWICSLPWRGD